MKRFGFVLAWVVCAVCAEGWACEVPALQPHHVDPTLSPEDETPPPPVSALKARLLRGRLPAGCSDEASACDDLGFVNLTYSPPDDAETPPGMMGYIVEVTRGTPPASLNVPDGPIRPDFAGQMSLSWDDSESAREELDFTLTVYPVDHVGNVGDGTDVRVRGEATPSCQIVPGGGGATPWVVLLVGLGWSARRRRALRDA